MAKDKQIARLLKADISMTSNLADIAKMLEKKGRGGDTILAHITKREAEMLKEMGGAGTVNPETGLLEFYDGEIDIQGGQDYQPIGLSGEAMTPQQVAAANPDLYYGGEIAPAGYSDVYVPTGMGTAAVGQVPTAYTPQQVGDYFTSQAAMGMTAPGDISYAPRLPTSREAFELGRVPTTPTAPETEKSIAQRLGLDKLSTADMIRLGLAGGGAAVGGIQARKAAKQAEAAKAEQQALAAPYQARGREMVRAAEAGELTPTGQQSLQAMQARLAQGVEARGGVGAAQASAQAEAFRQQLLAQQYDYGMRVTNIGDQLALGAIRTGMAADQALQQASANFYTQLASIAAGLPVAPTPRA